MSCPKLMEKSCSQLEIFDCFADILYKIMRSKVYKICFFRIKNTFLVSEVAKFVITRYLHYRRIVDKLNKS